MWAGQRRVSASTARTPYIGGKGMEFRKPRAMWREKRESVCNHRLYELKKDGSVRESPYVGGKKNSFRNDAACGREDRRSQQAHLCDRESMELRTDHTFQTVGDVITRSRHVISRRLIARTRDSDRRMSCGGRNARANEREPAITCFWSYYNVHNFRSPTARGGPCELAELSHFLNIEPH